MGPGQGRPGQGHHEHGHPEHGRPEQRRPAPAGYDLGVDLGTTWTAAAVRPLDRPGVRVVDLEGPGARQVPSVLLLDDDGSLLVGSAAEARAPGAPQRVVREFKRRLGDETPIIVGGTAISADSVAAEMVRWTADTVADQQGCAPRAVTVAHPAGWGPYRRRVFTEALGEVGLHDVHLLAEPEAAAVAHAAAGAVPPGRTVAVYDLGGGTFDAAVVQGVAGPAGLAVLGRGQGLEALGGIDFDEALFWHVCAQLGGAVAALDPTDPVGVRAVAGLRRACVAAKEALSVRPEVLVTVDLPGVRTQVRVTRAEFEEMIGPAVGRTVDVLWEVLDAAGIPPGALDGVLLVGGSSRIPLVARTVAGALGRPVALDPDPTTVVARGAALAAAGGMTPERRPGRGAGPVHPGPRGAPGPLARVAPVRAPGRLVGPPETSGPLPVGAHGPDRTAALLAGTASPRPSAARSTAGVALMGPAPASVPGPRHGAPDPDADHDADHDADAVTATTALPAGPATPTGLGLRPLPQRPPVRDAALPAAPATGPAPTRRRRRMIVAVGAGIALVAGGIVAVTVPVVSSDSAPKSLETALPTAGVPAAPDAGVLPPGTLAPTAPATATPAATASGATDAAATRPAARTTAPRAAVPAAPAAAVAVPEEAAAPVQEQPVGEQPVEQPPASDTGTPPTTTSAGDSASGTAPAADAGAAGTGAP